MEQTHTKRYNPKRKKGKKFKRLIQLFLIIFILVAGYSVYQFYKGHQLAKDSELKQEDFVGDKVSTGTVNYLLLGIDTRGEEKSRTDTMMLVSWNHDTDKVKLISFMRDIYAEIPGYSNYKLNTAYYLGGVQLTKDTITGMFGVPIHHYAIIDFKNFETMIDILAPSGVKIDVEKDMSEKIGVSLKAGEQQLNGQELLGYARFRMDGEGDFGRVRRQQQVIEAVKDSVLSVRNTKNLPKLVGAAQGYVVTDISSGEQLKSVLEVATSGVEIEKLTIPQEGTYSDKSYSHAGSVLEIDLEKNKQALNDFLEK